MRNLRNAKGFTLIELMIVVVIIGILAAIAIPKFNQVAKNAKESEADGILKQGYTLQEEYKQKYDTYAPNDDSLVRVGWDKDQEGKYYDDITVDAGDGDSFCIEAQAIDTAVTKNKHMTEARVVEDGLCP